MTDAALLPRGDVPQFYRHSGKAPATAFAAGLAFTVILGAIAGSALGAAEFVGHLIPSLKLMAVAEVLVVWGAGLLIGFGMTRLLGRFKARSPLLAYGCSLAAALVALYFAWAAWIYSYMLYSGQAIPYNFIAMPMHLVDGIMGLYDQGSWSISKDDVPKGIFLAGIWIAELTVLAVFAFRATRKELDRRVFCEQCGTWGNSRHLMQIADKDSANMQAGLLAGRSEALSNAERLPRGSAKWCDVTLEGCSTCDTLQALTLEHTALIPTKKGKSKKKSTKLVRRLLLTPEQTVQIVLVAASLDAPSPSPSASDGADMTAG
jgi:hypothetical protein